MEEFLMELSEMVLFWLLNFSFFYFSFIISIVGVVFIFVGYLLLQLKMSTLLSLVILIIYLGAMMIFMGYVCAITPNTGKSSGPKKGTGILLFLSLEFAFFSEPLYTELVTSGELTNFLFQSASSLFCMLMFMMFCIMFTVTMSQLTPKGSLRSMDF